ERAGRETPWSRQATGSTAQRNIRIFSEFYQDCVYTPLLIFSDSSVAVLHGVFVLDAWCDDLISSATGSQGGHCERTDYGRYCDRQSPVSSFLGIGCGCSSLPCLTPPKIDDRGGQPDTGDHRLARLVPTHWPQPRLPCRQGARY